MVWLIMRTPFQKAVMPSAFSGVAETPAGPGAAPNSSCISRDASLRVGLFRFWNSSPKKLRIQIPHNTNSPASRSEEHTSELQSRPHLVCRLLLEKEKN